MGQSTDDLLRELEAGGVLSGSSPPVKSGSRPPAPKDERRNSGLLFVVLAALMMALVGSLPFGSLALYPFSLFVTLVHETFHALAGTITGGSVLSLRVSPDLSGVTLIAGGTMGLIAPAGYLGATLAGAALIATPLRYARWAIGALAAFPLLALILFHPASVFTTIWCVLFLAGLGAAAWKLRDRAIQFLQILLGVACGLNAFRDLMTLFLISTTDSHIHTDAEAMSHTLGLPATVWAVLWTVISLVIMASAGYVLVRREAPSLARRLRGRRGATSAV